ncbi:ubiquitin thioesterase otulin isoform X2 [Brachyhypopomus gauderio]|uniref:ubiquitin thioesterase otulin isoform X2 n=1 Tax=Brachyhypopomus gauderio TaxID=698409 RepID=UPI004041ADF4
MLSAQVPSRPTLENFNQMVQDVCEQNTCQLKHCKTREMTSSMKVPPKKEASLSNQDGGRSRICPAGTPTSEENNSEEDLYRAAEDIERERQEKSRSHTASLLHNPEEQSSVAAPECLLSYGQREWKGDTTKSHLIRKGYEAIAQTFESLRRVRGDNYCALRATLFQLLLQSCKVPARLQDPDMIKFPKQMQSVQDLVDQWRFPFGSSAGEGRAVERLQRCLKLLRTKCQEAVWCVDTAERERVCEQVFEDTPFPEFCWLLYARDTSRCPRTFFTNHLRQVGFSGGLEQVEMFLLGYSLQQTIQVYRLYKTDSEEFVTYYPDDHRTDWPCLSLVTEDDRHYNVLVPNQAAVLQI